MTDPSCLLRSTNSAVIAAYAERCGDTTRLLDVLSKEPAEACDPPSPPEKPEAGRPRQPPTRMNCPACGRDIEIDPL